MRPARSTSRTSIAERLIRGKMPPGEAAQVLLDLPQDAVELHIAAGSLPELRIGEFLRRGEVDRHPLRGQRGAEQ